MTMTNEQIEMEINNLKSQLSQKADVATALLHKPICKGFFSDIIFK
ncbi:hypothetical protein [Acinetobacter baumannii]|nr:hypothetical protein [Acinetobacter baumannii]EKX6093074.1 hypothetical protein [Acinetobacter baumannii]